VEGTAAYYYCYYDDDDAESSVDTSLVDSLTLVRKLGEEGGVRLVYLSIYTALAGWLELELELELVGTFGVANY
jgi:hypothetical protein